MVRTIARFALVCSPLVAASAAMGVGIVSPDGNPLLYWAVFCFGLLPAFVVQGFVIKAVQVEVARSGVTAKTLY